MYSARIDDLIALGHIVQDFEKFSEELKRIWIKPKKANTDILDLGHNILMLSQNKFIFNRKIRQFYAENEETIRTIMRYSSIVEFLVFNYNNRGDIGPDTEFFYHYMLENKDKINQILSLLEHLKKLGFRGIEFNENMGEDECLIETDCKRNVSFKYSDGIEIIPNSIPSLVKYNIKNGNYIMTLFKKSFTLLQYNGSIKVQNLLFDVQLLPENLSIENTFDKIIELKKSQSEECRLVSQSVHLRVFVDIISQQYNWLLNTMDGIGDTTTKAELLQILEQMKKQLDTMQAMSSKFDSSIMQDGKITEDQLEEETKFSKRKQYHL